jgi:hypothetical protein
LAVNLIPLEFGDERPIMDAYKDFLQAVSSRLDGTNDEIILRNSGTKTVRLIYEIARSLKFNIRETDLQTNAYASDGWVVRDRLQMDAQQASRDLVNVLLIQSRLMAGSQLSAEERAILRLPEENKPSA